MTHKVTKPIALDESFRTTEQNPQNIADVLANKLDAIKSAIENGGSGEMEAAFECHYNVTSATDIYNAMQEKKVPFFYNNGVVAQLWKVETNKYTFRTTSTRVVEGENILDIVDYIVNGSVWSTATKTISGGSSSQQAYLAKVESSVNFDTTGLSGMQSIISVDDVPADGVYQLSIFMCITPKTASATKSDLVFQFTGTSGTGMPNTTFHAVVDDSQTFAQQLSFSTTLNLKAGTNSLKLSCDGLSTGYFVFVDDLTVAQIVNGSSSGGGSGIYGSLQDAIADAASLNVGDIFETNGFHTSGDGGAARYLVSDTGTANGMDIVQLAAGKLAVLQINQNREMYPEQFGYKRDTERNDLTPYLVRMTTMPNTPVRNIRLMPTGSSSAVYVMKTTWNITAASVSVRGHCEPSSGWATQIWFMPNSYGAEYTPMFKFGQRGFDMKNLVLFNRPWFDEGNKHNCVCLYMALSNLNKMWYDFDSLVIQGFDIGVAKVPPTGELSDGLIWHCEFHRLSMALNNKNVYIKGLSYVTKFDNCFLTVNDTGAESIVLEETFSTEFDRCNFGIFNPSTTILHCQDYLVSGRPVDVRWMQCKFTNCNFELETNDSHPLPENASGFFIKCDDHDDFNLELDNCDFIQTPLSRNNIYTNRPIRLGARTKIILRQCCGPYADVNYSGNEFYGWDFQKRMFDGAHPPKKEVGSFKLEHCIGLIPPPNNQWGSAYLPTIMMDNMGCPICDNNTKFTENYPTASDGIVLANLDKANLEVKLGASMVQVTSPATGKVRIGDRIYDYVTIDGRKWITTNLQLWTMNTRQWHFPDHEDFGFYYGLETFAEVDALLPAGWRRPNYADCQSVISQGYAAVQALGQTAFPDATNTTGLSILPCYRWTKPNTSVTFNRGFFWGPEESGVGWHAVNVQASSISYAGWPYSNANTLKIPIRVCCDV